MRIEYISKDEKRISFLIKLGPEESTVGVGQGGKEVKLIGSTFSFELPFSVNQIHPDLVALSLLTIVLPWVKKKIIFPEKVSLVFAEKVKQVFGIVVENADELIIPRRLGKIDAVSFSGGVDSVATSCLLPDDHIKVMFLRSDHSAIDCQNVNYSVKAQKQISDYFENSYYVKSDLEHIVGPYPQYPTWVTIALPCFLLADYFNFKSVNFGSIVGSSDIKNGGKYKKTLNPNAGWKELFLVVGLYLSKPVSAVTEIGTSTIVKKAGLNKVATSCQFGSMNKPCMKCFKCFRKYMMSSTVNNTKLDKKIIDNFIKLRAVQDYFLSSPPVYFQHILMYAFTRLDCSEQPKIFQLFRKKVLLTGVSVDWCDKSYNKSLKYYIPDKKLRNFVVDKLSNFVNPMSDEDQKIFENWDLYREYDKAGIKKRLKEIDDEIRDILVSRFSYQSSVSNASSGGIINYSADKKIKLSLKQKTITKDLLETKIRRVVHYGQIKEGPKISLIVVAYNEGDDLIRNLECWQKQTFQDFELILVDNGLDEETVAKVKEFDLLHIVCRENTGCCGGRNIGAVWAKGEILVFGDADGYNLESYLESIEKSMTDKSVVAVRGKVLPINKSLQEEFMPAHYDLGDRKIVSLIDAEGNSAWRTKDYLRAGGFEESLAGGEGLVLQYRMVEFFGYDKNAFIYDPKVVLYHDYHQSEKKLLYKIKQSAIVNGQLRLKYPFLGQFIDYYRQFNKSNASNMKKDYSQTVKNKMSDIQKAVADTIDATNEERITRRRREGLLHYAEEELDFSVIIPCYNLGSLLLKGIDSVFAQTLEKIEVIVVDDQSQEKETKDILDKLEQEQKVKVIHLEKNSGVSVARNTGIEQAKGKYILCLDADDHIESTYLEKAFNIFESDEKVGIVSCWSRNFGANNSSWKPADKVKVKDALINSPVHTASCFRKSDWEVGGIYDPKLRGFEDWDHWLRLMKLRPVVRVIPEFLFNYYIRPGSKVETSNKNAIQLLSRIIENHKEFYEENYVYVITRQHKRFADNASQKRLEKDERVSVEQLRAELSLVKNSKFWKMRTAYLKLKHYVVFIFLNPRKFMKEIIK